MKKLLVSLTLFLLVSQLKAQDIYSEKISFRNEETVMFRPQMANIQSQTFSITYLNSRYPAKYTHPLKKVGRILTFVGVPVMILGAVMVANATELSYTCVNGNCQGDPLGGFGILFLAAGTASTATGITFWAIGGSKSSK